MTTLNGDDLNLERLLETRMLVSANSGGGKSYCLRNILENTHGKVQQIVLDMEGEFSTLREEYDYVLIGKGGDLPADVRSAPLLAKKLLELNASAIIDLYELHQHERIRYVKLFLDAMVNVDKELWHPVLVVLDEAHIFAPEKRESEAMSAVADIATRGRKRGFCLIAATQRLSKLNKDVAAELNNVMIGRTGLDIDIKRASESLGFTSREQNVSLRNLSPGEFFVYGPAISNEVKKVKIGPVKTSHPKSGQRAVSSVSAPRSKILKVLDNLRDLPQKAEEELREVADYKRELANLRRELSIQKKPVVSPEQSKRIQEEATARAVADAKRAIQREIDFRERLIKETEAKFARIRSIIDAGTTKAPESKPLPTFPSVSKKTPVIQVDVIPSDVEVDRCGRAILSLLYNNPDRMFQKNMIALFTGYSHTSGGFQNSLSKLNGLRFIARGNEGICITEHGIANAPSVLGKDLDLHKQFTIDGWKQRLPKCESSVFTWLMENRGIHTKDEVGFHTGYSPTSGGFQNAISRLNTLGLIIRRDGGVELNEKILEEYA